MTSTTDPADARARRVGGGAPWRARAALALLAVDAAFVVLVVAGIHGPTRFAVGLAFALLVPGWSIVGLLHLDRPALELALTIATSLALLLVCAQLLLSLSLWHLEAFAIFLALACAPSLLWQFAERARAPRTTT